MKKSIKNLLLATWMLLAIASFTSCAKKGDVGPAGKDGTNGTNGVNGTNGSTGPAGTNGTNGTSGSNGKDGNANVIGSNPFSATQADWIYQSGNGGYYYIAVTSPLITQAIVEKGVVMCYLKINSNSWTPLPFDVYSYTFTVGGLAILYDYNANPGGQTFRLVTISATNMQANPNLDLNNYRQVVKTLNLPE